MLDRLRKDLAFAIRTFGRRPVATATLVLTLALGIGGATAIFTVVDAVLIRELPFRDPSSLVSVWRAWPSWRGQEGLDYVWDHIQFPTEDYEDVAADAVSFSGLEAYSERRYPLTEGDRTYEVSVGAATTGFFRLLGVSAARGRTFAEQEGLPVSDVGARVAVLGNELWRTRYGADPGMVGRKITLDGRTYEVVGVLPAEFRWSSDAVTTHANGGAIDEGQRDLWIPLDRAASDCGNCLEIVARLRSGVPIGQARSEVQRLLRRRNGAPADQIARVVARREYLTGDVRGYLSLLLGMSGSLLLIACLNSAGLLVGESRARTGEIATRSALGAGRRRLIAQLLTESVLLGLLAAAAGTVLAWLGTRALLVAAPPMPRLEEVRIGARVLGFAVAVGAGTGVLFGLAPALSLVRGGPIVSGARGSTRSRAGGILHANLVGGQVALSVMLLVAGGLFARSITGLMSVDPGFVPEGLTTLRVAIPANRLEREDARTRFLDGLLEAARGLPGVASISGAADLPFSGGLGSSHFGYDDEDATGGMALWKHDVLPDYVETLGMRMLEGRPLDRGDDAAGERVALINQAAAERLWPGESALGRTLWDGGLNGTAWTVVGVVADVRHRSLAVAADPSVYRSIYQRRPGRLSLVVRTRGDQAAVGAALQRAIWSFDSSTPIVEAGTMTGLVRAAEAEGRFVAFLVWTFAGLAALLAAVGIFGVTARTVAARTRELGIRMALGATPRGLAWLAARSGLARVAVGVAVGLILSALAAGAVVHLLFGVSAHDPLTYAAVGALATLAYLVAGYLPTRRLMSIDPREVISAD